MNRRLTTATVATALALLALPASQAAAGTQVLRPSGDYSSGSYHKTFATNPGGKTGASVLDDAVQQPAAPSTAADFVFPPGDESGSVGLLFPAVNLAPGSTLSLVRAWVYAGTGSKRTMSFGIWGGSDYLTSETIAKNQTPGWRSVTTTAALSAEQLQHLALGIWTTGGDESGRTAAYASYLEIETIDPPAPPPAPVQGGAEPLQQAPLFSPITKPLTVTGAGRAPVPVTCPAGRARACRGTLTLELLARRPKGGASIARRGARLVGQQRFTIAPGSTVNVRVRLARTVRRLLKRRGRAWVSARVSRRGAPNLDKRKTITLKKARRKVRRRGRPT